MAILKITGTIFRSYITRRLLMAPLVMLVMLSVTFFLIRLAPGGPFSSERDVSPAVEQALRERYALDQPLPMQYWSYLRGVCRGDLGPSIRHRGRDVNTIVADHLPVSFLLGGLALSLAVCVGVSAGFLAALKARSWIDYTAMGACVLGISLPAFVIGPLLQAFFARYLHWFPVSGSGSPKHVVLPALALASPFAARFARLARAGLLEVLSQDFIRTARSKGLRERVVLLRHAVRGGLLPVVGYLGPAIASITTGSLVVEKIFGIPGLGREFVESALSRDYMLVMGTVVVYGGMIVLCNVATDAFHACLDPRMRERNG
ncbi:MAG: ABC transporter permease [Lentisphaeria bacterium]|nr:ABC transporter permease [Lentisphaeria bacterium]